MKKTKEKITITKTKPGSSYYYVNKEYYISCLEKLQKIIQKNRNNFTDNDKLNFVNDAAYIYETLKLAEFQKNNDDRDYFILYRQVLVSLNRVWKKHKKLTTINDDLDKILDKL